MTARTICSALALVLLAPACARTSADTSEPEAPSRRGDTAERAERRPAPRVTATAAELSDSQVGGVILAIHAGEAEQARVASVRAEDPSVKKFATMLARDHNDGEDRTLRMMRKLKLRAEETELSEQLRLRAKAMAQTLRDAEPGPGFDRSYLRIEIEAHETALTAVVQALKMARRPELETELLLVRAALELHVQDARDLLAKRTPVALR